MDLFQELRDRRKAKGLTQVEVARLIGIPQSHVSKLENGALNPTLRTLRQYAWLVGADLFVMDRATHKVIQTLRSGDYDQPAYTLDDD